MRLHLPKALLAAVLAACAALPTWAENYTAGTKSSPITAGLIQATPTEGGDSVGLGTLGTGDTVSVYTNAGYLPAGATINATLDIGQLILTNGTSNTTYTFNGAITGEADAIFRVNSRSGGQSTGYIIPQTFKFIGSLSEFKGKIIRGTGESDSSYTGMTLEFAGTESSNTVAANIYNSDGKGIISSNTTFTGSTVQFGSLTINSGKEMNVATSGSSIAISTSLTNNGTLKIGAGVNMTVSGSLNTSAIQNAGTITISAETDISLGQLITFAADTTSGFIAANSSYSFILATGGGTVSLGDNITYSFLGSDRSNAVVMDAGNKQGSVTIGASCYYIAPKDTKTYSAATESTPGWIFVSKGATLSELPSDASDSTSNIGVSIVGNGTISMAAGAGQVTIAADKLTDFYGGLVIESGRFNEVNNGHVFSNVTVKNGGQFCINDGYNYTGNVSIAGTGWSNTSDAAWNGALRLGLNSTLSGKLTLTGDACIMAHNGANVTLAGEVDAGDRTLTAKGTGTLNFRGNATIGSLITDSVSVAVNGGGTLSILKNSNLQKLCSNGAATITLGDGANSSITTANRIELSDVQGSVNTTTLTVSANSVLKITGTSDGTGTQPYKNASAILGEWEASTTANISGTMLSAGASLQAGDTGYTMNIESTGLVAAKGIKRCNEGKTATIAINLKGGKLVLGETGIKAAGVTSTSTGGVIGSYADTTTIASGLSLTSGTTTIDTSKYTINTDNTVTVGENATGSTITINGIISGSGTLKVSGGGILVLNGNNTYTNETRLSGGEIQAGNANAFGTGKLAVDGDSSISGTVTIGDYIGIEGNVVLTIKENSAITLSNTGIYKGMWVKAGSSVVLKNGASVTGYGVTVSHLNENSELAAESGGEGQFGISGQLHEEKLTIKESAISLADQATLRNKLDGGTVSSTGSTTIGWLDENGTHGGGSIGSLADTSASDTLKVASDLAVTKSAAITGTLNIGEKATTAINSAREDNTASSIGTLTGSGTLKATGGTTEVTNASGFSGTLAATGGNIELQTAADLTLSEVVVSGGSSISGATSYTADKVSIGAGEAGSLVGNLSIKANGTITLDASDGATTETGGTKGLSLSALTTTFADEGTTTTAGSLTLGSGLTLNLLNLDLKQGQSLTLFSGVTGVTGIDDMGALKSGSLEAKTVFTNLTAGDFNLSFDETNHIVALVAQRNVPEPTTATLSLLALMGLAARRRRRKA